MNKFYSRDEAKNILIGIYGLSKLDYVNYLLSSVEELNIWDIARFSGAVATYDASKVYEEKLKEIRTKWEER